MMFGLRIFLLSLVLVQRVSAQECAISLPNRDVIRNELSQLLSSTSNTNLLDFHFTCLASGKVQGTYRSVSLLANYTTYGNTTVRTIHFAMQCFEDSWSHDELEAQSSTSLMYSTELLSATKRDCLRCNGDLMNICKVCTSHCSVCESNDCCRTCSTSSGFYILAWDNCSCISYAGHLLLLLFIISAIWITVSICILITSLLLQKYKKFIFRGKKEKEVINTTTDALYDAINESEVNSSGKTKESLNQESGSKNQKDTIYEAVDEMEPSQHDGDHQDQDISMGHNPSYSTTVKVLNVQPQESENAIQESHPKDEPLEDLRLGTNPSYSSVSFQATVPQNYEVLEISDHIIDDGTQLHQDISLGNNPSYSALPTMTQNVDPDTPEIYEALDEEELLGSSNEPPDISVGDNPSYVGFKNADEGPLYQDASTIGTSTQDVSTLSATIGQQAMSAHSSDSELKRESNYEEILQDDDDDYI
uniref:Uncharacterized protein n=1 Tax=Amphimedon queenslandica TaxID=400682 RepID=A0A1X7V8I8_AMPQE